MSVTAGSEFVLSIMPMTCSYWLWNMRNYFWITNTASCSTNKLPENYRTIQVTKTVNFRISKLKHYCNLQSSSSFSICASFVLGVLFNIPFLTFWAVLLLLLFFQLILWQFSLFRDIASYGWLMHLIAWLPSPVLTHDTEDSRYIIYLDRNYASQVQWLKK